MVLAIAQACQFRQSKIKIVRFNDLILKNTLFLGEIAYASSMANG